MTILSLVHVAAGEPDDLAGAGGVEQALQLLDDGRVRLAAIGGLIGPVEADDFCHVCPSSEVGVEVEPRVPVLTSLRHDPREMVNER